MDLKQMRLFLATATEGNLTRAAARLHMAQPPLTRQIRQIEEELGVQLFVRTPRGMVLTAAGAALAEELPHVLALAQRAEERALRASSGDLGHLDVAVFGSGMLSAVPELLARFRRTRPEVRMRVHSLTKSEQAEALRAHRIHIGFHRLPSQEDDLSAESVGNEPMYVGLPLNHPLAAQSEIQVRDLANEPMILYPNLPVPGLAQEVMSAFRQEKVPLRIEHEVGDVLSCVAMVAAGLGLCVTTESTSRLLLPGLTYRRFRSKHLSSIGLSCVYRRNDASPVLNAFLSVVRAYAVEPRPSSPGGFDKAAAAELPDVLDAGLLGIDTTQAERNVRLQVLMRDIEATSPDPTSPSREILMRLGDRWSSLLLNVLSTGSYRNAEMLRVVNEVSRRTPDTPISQRMLTLRLRVLERDGLVRRSVGEGKAPAVHYSLTALGEGLVQRLRTVLNWAGEHSIAIQAAQQAFDTPSVEALYTVKHRLR